MKKKRDEGKEAVKERERGERRKRVTTLHYECTLCVCAEEDTSRLVLLL